MMQEPVNSNTRSHSLGTLVPASGIQKNMRAYSTAPNAGNRSTSKCVRLSRTLFENSVLVTVLTIGLLFGLIQESAGSSQVLARTDVKTTYSSAWTGNSPTFSRHADQMAKHYFYESLQMSVSIAGTYTFTSSSPINTYGYIYNDEFKSTDPSLKLIAQDDDSNGQGQFKITAILQPGQKYILVATTFNPDTKGEFSILSSGPATVDMHSTLVSTKSVSGLAASASRSVSSSAFVTLSSSSPVFNRPNSNSGRYYYQAIQVVVYTSGTYDFTSSSSIDTYACLYSGTFYPSSPSLNMITCDDDAGDGNQFLISYSLWSGSTYTLVVTTFSASATSSFYITASGPASATLTAITPSGSTIPSSLSTTHTGYLSRGSTSFRRPSGSSGTYYLEAISVVVSMYSEYIFRSSSSIDTYGCLYRNSFNPSSPSSNLIKCDDDGGLDQQFLIQYNLQSESTYILVVTTYRASTTGSFTITVVGPGSITLTAFTPEPNSSNLGKILGITFGCIALFVIILAIIIYRIKKRTPPSQRNMPPRNIQPGRPQNVPMSNVYMSVQRPNGSTAPYTISGFAPGVAYGEAPPPSYDTYLSSLKPPQ